LRACGRLCNAGATVREIHRPPNPTQVERADLTPQFAERRILMKPESPGNRLFRALEQQIILDY